MTLSLKSSILSKSPGSPAAVPGKFITSARPAILGFRARGSSWAASRTAPEVSSGQAGTQEGARKRMSRGRPLAASNM